MSFIYKAEAKELGVTIVNNSANSAYVETVDSMVGIDKFIANSNEKVTIYILSNKTLKKLCFEFEINASLIDVKEIKKTVPLWFDTDIKIKEVKTDKKICYDDLGLTSDQIYYSIGYNGERTKYNITLDDVKLDPYIVGTLSSDDKLVLYIPFDNSTDVIFSSIESTINASNTRLNTTSGDLTITGAGCVDPANFDDDSYATYAATYSPCDGSSYTCTYTYEYMKKAEDTGMVLELKDEIQYYNYTIPDSCFDTYTNRIEFKIYTEYHPACGGCSCSNWQTVIYCYDGTWYTLGTNTLGGATGSYVTRLYDIESYSTNQSNFNAYNEYNIPSLLLVGKNLTAALAFNVTNTTEDISMNGYNGVGYGAAFYPDGLYFDGTDDYVNLSNFSFQNFSITFKTNSTGNGGGNNIIFSNGGGYNYGGCEFGISTATSLGYTCVNKSACGTSDCYEQGTFTVPNLGTTYHMFTMTMENRNLSLFLDGSYIDSHLFKNDTFYASSIRSFIGRRYYPSSEQYFKGMIPYLIIHNRSLNSSEIKILHQGTSFPANALNESNRSISLTGSEYLYIQNNSLFNVSHFTVSAFVNIPTTSSYMNIVGKNYLAGYSVGISDTGKLYSGINNDVKFSNSTVPVNQWVHLAVTYDGNYTKYYINGILNNSEAHTANPTANNYNLHIGRGSPLNNNYFVGKLDEVMLFNRPLTAAEIRLLARGYNSSIEVSMLDEITKLHILEFDLDIIGDNFAEEYSTTTGQMVVNGMPEGFYTLRYSSADYPERTYYYNLTEHGNHNLTLYLLGYNSSSNITATVYDNYNNLIEDVYVQYLRYDITNNSYVLMGISKTDSSGETVFPAQMNAEFYKFFLYYPYGTIRLTTAPQYITSENINFQINLEELPGFDFNATMNIIYNLSFNNVTNKFRYDFAQVDGTALTNTLDIYSVSPMEVKLVNTSSLAGAAGSIILSVPEINGTTYVAQAKVTYPNAPPNATSLVASLSHSFDPRTWFGKLGLFGVILLTCFIIFISVYSINLTLVILPLPLLLASIIGLVAFPISIAIMIEILAIVLVFIINQ